MSDNSVLIQIKGDVADINAKLADLKAHVGRVNEETKKVGSDGPLSFAKLGAAVAAGVVALQQLADKTRACIEAYMESEAAAMKLAVAMRNQGDYTRDALGDLTDYAGALQDLTGYEDDATVSMMGNLKSYGMTNEEVKKATLAALDFATAKRTEGMTVEQAGQILGKAYVGSTEQLKRYGIVVDENLSRTQRYEAVVKQLNERFGGAAQADLNTYTGQWRQLKSQLGDIAEVLGLSMLKAIEAVTSAFSLMGGVFWKVVNLILEGWALIAGGASKMAKLIGMEQLGAGLETISDALAAGAKNAQEAADQGIASAEKYYDMLTSFREVDDIVSKMKPGKPGGVPDDADLEKKRKEILLKSIEERVRAEEQYWVDISKMMDDEQKELAKHYEEATRLSREGAVAALEETLKVGDAAELARSAGWEHEKKIAAERRAALEAEIQGRIAELDLAEKAGTAHIDTLQERLALESELLRLRQISQETIDKATDPSGWYAQASAIADTRQKIADLSREVALSNPFGAIALGLRDVANEARETGKQIYDAITRAADGMTEALVEFTMTGKSNFKDLADSIIRDMIRIAYQQSITGPLAGAAGGFFAGLFSSSGSYYDRALGTTVSGSGNVAPLHHGGGKVGLPAMSYRLVLDPDILPRRHGGGLAPDERVVINKVGERYVTEEQNEWLTGLARAMSSRSSAAPQSVRVEIKNESGQKMAVTDTGVSFNAQEMVVTVWLDAFSRNAFGLRTALGG